jgi:hypothetical protein
MAVLMAFRGRITPQGGRPVKFEFRFLGQAFLAIDLSQNIVKAWALRSQDNSLLKLSLGFLQLIQMFVCPT